VPRRVRQQIRPLVVSSHAAVRSPWTTTRLVHGHQHGAPRRRTRRGRRERPAFGGHANRQGDERAGQLLARGRRDRTCYRLVQTSWRIPQDLREQYARTTPHRTGPSPSRRACSVDCTSDVLRTSGDLEADSSRPAHEVRCIRPHAHAALAHHRSVRLPPRIVGLSCS